MARDASAPRHLSHTAHRHRRRRTRGFTRYLRAAGGAAHVPAAQPSAVHMFPQRIGGTCTRRTSRRWPVRSHVTARASAWRAHVPAAQPAGGASSAASQSIRAGADGHAVDRAEPRAGAVVGRLRMGVRTGADSGARRGAKRSAGALRRSARTNGDTRAPGRAPQGAGDGARRSWHRRRTECYGREPRRCAKPAELASASEVRTATSVAQGVGVRRHRRSRRRVVPVCGGERSEPPGKRQRAARGTRAEATGIAVEIARSAIGAESPAAKRVAQNHSSVHRTVIGHRHHRRHRHLHHPRYRNRCGHGSVSVMPVVGNGGDAPRTLARRPASGQTSSSRCGFR